MNTKTIAKIIVFDFSKWDVIDLFYEEFGDIFSLPNYWGKNLDALWDVISAKEIDLPVKIILCSLPNTQQSKGLLAVFDDAHRLFGAAFQYRCVDFDQ